MGDFYSEIRPDGKLFSVHAHTSLHSNWRDFNKQINLSYIHVYYDFLNDIYRCVKKHVAWSVGPETSALNNGQFSHIYSELDIFQSKCQNGNPETDIKMVSSFKMYNDWHFNVCKYVNSFTFTKNKQTGSHSYRQNIQYLMVILLQ